MGRTQRRNRYAFATVVYAYHPRGGACRHRLVSFNRGDVPKIRPNRVAGHSFRDRPALYEEIHCLPLVASPLRSNSREVFAIEPDPPFHYQTLTRKRYRSDGVQTYRSITSVHFEFHRYGDRGIVAPDDQQGSNDEKSLCDHGIGGLEP